MINGVTDVSARSSLHQFSLVNARFAHNMPISIHSIAVDKHADLSVLWNTFWMTVRLGSCRRFAHQISRNCNYCNSEEDPHDEQRPEMLTGYKYFHLQLGHRTSYECCFLTGSHSPGSYLQASGSHNIPRHLMLNFRSPFLRCAGQYKIAAL